MARCVSRTSAGAARNGKHLVRRRLARVGAANQATREAPLNIDAIRERRRRAIPEREDNMSDTRIETDSLGQVEVPATALWGAQTQRPYSTSALDRI
jgi:hypothetical protein